MEILASRSGLPHRFVRWVTFCVLLVVPLTASGQELEEYDAKAAFLYNFTKFVEWPSVSDSSVFAICILGDDPFGPTLDHLVKGKTVSGRPLQVRRLKDAADARQCQMVFVGRDEETKATKLIEAVHGLPILTVGEQHRFGHIGGMIYLSMKNYHINIVINTDVTEKAGLKISAKLMSVAKPFKENEGVN